MRNYLILLILLFLFFIQISFLKAEKILIKNATLYKTGGIYQEESYIVIKNKKIFELGKVSSLKSGIFDKEYDLKGAFIYPSFIDVYTNNFQITPKKKVDKKFKKNKNIRRSLLERNYFITNNVIDKLVFSKTKIKKNILSGFSYIHLIPSDGIISGTSAVSSLVSEKSDKTILVPARFMNIQFKVNEKQYPTTAAGIISDLVQIKENCFHYHKLKRQQYYNPSDRLEYNSSYETLLPYFKLKERFLIITKNIIEQRMTEILSDKLGINPVIVLSPDGWRRKIKKNSDIILPLKFKPPLTSKYSKLGKKLKKEAEKKIYPKELAKLFLSHSNISLAPPSSGDYKCLFANIRKLIKNGVSEEAIIRALTITPAKLLKIEKYAGEICVGKLASIFVSDKKIFEDKAKIKMAFVEGVCYKLPERKGDLKKPVTDISGNWNLEIESPMGKVQSKLSITQENNSLEGKLSSGVFGSLSIENGIISGNEVSFSVTANLMGNETLISISGKIEGTKFSGTINLGSFGEATFIGKPEN